MEPHRRLTGDMDCQAITTVDDASDICSDAVWIGQLAEEDLADASHLELVDGQYFDRARFLVWSGGQTRGFIECATVEGHIDVDDLAVSVAELPEVEPRQSGWPLPPMTVAVCTRDRPDQLREVLRGLIELDYPHFEVLVVDNHVESGSAAAVVDEFESTNGVAVRVVGAAGKGLSIARNVAIQHARYERIAFTDDDVIVDALWLQNLAYGFGRDERVVCVCGAVPSAELQSKAQLYFDRRVAWARCFDPVAYDLERPPADDRLFPMHVAQFGTGANFAAKRSALIELGGFDEGLGIGSPTGGGEDIDMFVRIVLAGHLLVRVPSAVVWHRHRRTAQDLDVQVYNYGLGLGAWIANLATRPRTFGMAARRLIPAVKHLRAVTTVENETSGPVDPEMEALYGRELQGVLRGAFALLRSRFEGRRATPLKAPSSKLGRLFGAGIAQNWGDPGNSILAHRLCTLAVVIAMLGSLGVFPWLPTPISASVVGAFTLGGPGCLVMSWYSRLPVSILLPLVPAVSLAVCIVAVSGLLMLGFYVPTAVLGVLTLSTAIGGLVRRIYLSRRAETDSI